MAMRIAGPLATRWRGGSEERERNAVIHPGAGTLIGRAVLEGRPVQIEDAWTDPHYEAKEDAREGGIRTMLGVPLMREGEVIGAIGLARGQVEPFTDNQIALVQNFAAQAVIAIENTRLLTETREALDQQTATAEVLQVINSSPGDLAPVFGAMLDKALQLCDANYGYLLTYDGEGLVPVADRGNPAFSAWVRERGKIVPEPGTINERIIAGEAVVQVADVINDPFDQSDTAMRRAVLEIGGFRTVLTVALRKDELLLGVIHIYRREVRAFSDRQVALLQNFAAQAVIAMENARLITETRENLERQTATSDILRVIAASPGDAEGTLRKIAETTMRLFNAAGTSFRIADGNAFSSAIVVGRGAEDVGASLSDPDHLVRPRTLPGTVIHENRQIHLPDLDHLDPAFADWPGPPVFRKAGMRTLVGTPLRRQDQAFGALIVYRDELRPFTGEELQLLQSFADQAVIAMENARLLTETREALEQQTATAEVLGVINSSPGDLAPVFDAMLEKAVRLCEAAYGLMFVVDGDRIHIVAQRNVPKALSDYLAKSPPQIGRDTMLGRALLDRQIMHTADPTTEAPYREGVPLAVKTVELGGARAFLMAPLTTDQAVLGIFAVFRTEARAFTDKQVALTQNFAAQAVIAMENARLLTETREALDQQTATAEVLQVINSSPGDLAPVFDAMLEKAMRLCDAALSVLFRYDGTSLHLIGVRGWTADEAPWFQKWEPVPGDAMWAIVNGADVIHVADIVDTDEYRSGIESRVKMVDQTGARTAAWIPLRKDDALVGVIVIFRREVRPFTDKQIALLRNFAAQAVIAMENARLLGELRQRTEEVADLNRGLEARVAEQVDELGRVGRLKRFLAPQLAELIVSQGDEKILESHRREIVVVFCDLRGYTAFTETAEPEEVLDFLREYHGALGPLVSHFEGTLDQFSGDGIMVFFNDPVPIPDPAERAVKMAMAMREEASALTALWRRRGRELGFGAGIAQGYATLGQIGFSERSGYTAIGTVCNVAARLCAEAKDGQILIAQRVAAGLDGSIALEDIGPLSLKGITQPVIALNVAPDGSAASRLRLV
jgi:GAF domain-containing protein